MPPTAAFRSLLLFDSNHPLFPAYKIAKRIAIGIVGGTVLVMGVIMMVTPGPGIAGILVGLGILGIEFAWARIWLKKIKQRAQKVAHDIKARATARKDGDAPPPPTS
jgi:tellurite resistance protein TerC